MIEIYLVFVYFRLSWHVYEDACELYWGELSISYPIGTPDNAQHIIMDEKN